MPSQGCTQEWMQEIVLLIDNELPDCRRQQADEHISHCRSCQVFYHSALREDRLLAGRVQHESHQLTPQFSNLVMSSIDSQTIPTLAERMIDSAKVFQRYFLGEGKWHTAVAVTIIGCLIATNMSFHLGSITDPYYLPMMKGGEQYTAILPDDFIVDKNTGEFFYLFDGSVVYATPNTSFVVTDYPKNIEEDPVDKERRIVLWYGQLYLDVAPANQGFTVVTPNAEVKVFGTQFYVHSSKGREKKTTVAVREGRVMVEKRNQTSFTVLTDNEMTNVSGIGDNILMNPPLHIDSYHRAGLNTFARTVAEEVYKHAIPSFNSIQMDINPELLMTLQ